MRNYNEMYMLNMIECAEQYVPVVQPAVTLSDADKCGIQSFRNRIERAQNKRVPIFDRTKLNNICTIGHMAKKLEIQEAVKFQGFGQMIAAELQKAGL